MYTQAIRTRTSILATIDETPLAIIAVAIKDSLFAIKISFWTNFRLLVKGCQQQVAESPRCMQARATYLHDPRASLFCLHRKVAFSAALWPCERGWPGIGVSNLTNLY